MEVTRVPLAERIEMAQDGRTAQPEYLPSLIRQWGKTSIRAYFGNCTAELERFCELMRLAPEDDLTYQDKVTGKDTYFGAEEAVEFGLADSIVEKMERRSA